ncbi:MAG: hypothetical protein J2P19_35165 [Pseudonocardia sp.]|nr:hypothetical protein [Pseudonocardia sp.]
MITDRGPAGWSSCSPRWLASGSSRSGSSGPSPTTRGDRGTHPREMTYAAAISEAIHLEMARDNDVLLFGQSVGASPDDPFVRAFGLYFRRETGPARIEPVPIGRAAVVRPGRDATVVALSRLVSEALLAAEQLATEGVEIEVIDPRTLVPLDLDTIVTSVRRTNRLVVRHEAVRHGGFGAESTASVQRSAFDYLDAPIERVASPFQPIPLTPSLEDAYLPGAAEVRAAVLNTLGRP